MGHFNCEKTIFLLSIEIKSKILLKNNKSSLLSLLKGKNRFSLDPQWWLLFSSFLLFQNHLNKSINHLWYGIKHIMKTELLIINFCNLAQQLIISKQTHKLFKKILWEKNDKKIIKKYVRWIIDNDKSKLDLAIAFILHNLTLNLSTYIFILETFQLNNFQDRLILNILEKMFSLHEDMHELSWSSLIHFHEGRGNAEKVSDIYSRA